MNIDSERLWLVFSALVFAFAVREGARNWRAVAKALIKLLRNDRSHPAKLVLISIVLTCSGVIGMGPGGYYGLDVISHLNKLGWI